MISSDCVTVGVIQTQIPIYRKTPTLSSAYGTHVLRRQNLFLLFVGVQTVVLLVKKATTNKVAIYLTQMKTVEQ